MKPVYVVIGTRAQFIKVAPLLRMLLDQGYTYQLIYTAQHQETIEEILHLYKLPRPDKVLYHREEANTRGLFIKWFFSLFFQALFKAKKILPEKGVVLTHGDTFTTWISALMAKRAGSKVAHMESGLRSFNIFEPFPEEISRLITFSLTDIYFCPNDWAMNNLRKYKGVKVNTKVNPIYDAVVYALNHPSDKKFDFLKDKYAVLSIHRYENIFTSRLTDLILPVVEEISQNIKIVMTVHPSTRKRLQKLNLYDRLANNKNIVMHDRFDHNDFIYICSKAEYLITDGGSNQEEISYIGTPTILFRKTTERTEGLNENIVLSMLDRKIIFDFIKNYKKYRRPPIKVDISPSQIIINYLKENNYLNDPTK